MSCTDWTSVLRPRRWARCCLLCPEHQFRIPTRRVTARKIGELLPVPQTQNSLSVDVKALRRVVHYQIRFAFGIAHCPKKRKNVVVQMEFLWVLIGSTMISKRTASCSLQPAAHSLSGVMSSGVWDYAGTPSQGGDLRRHNS